MVVVNSGNISPDRYDLILGILNELYRYTSSPGVSTIFEAVVSPTDKVLVTNGVHYSEFDSEGEYHFNIRLTINNEVQLRTYHMYVQPVLVTNVNNGIIIDDYGSVDLVCANYWMYQFSHVTW